MKVYVVEALRWADRENHSYVVGVFDNQDAAQEMAKIEEAWRGGNKYKCVINTYELRDRPYDDKAEWYNSSNDSPSSKNTDPRLYAKVLLEEKGESFCAKLQKEIDLIL